MRDGRRVKRVMIALVALVLGITALALPAGADPQNLEEAQRKKAHAQERQDELSAAQQKVLDRISELDEKRAEVEGQVADLDAELATLDQRIEEVTDDLTEAQQRVALLTSDLQRVLHRLDDRTDLFTERAIATYKAGPAAYIDGLLSAETFNDLVDRQAYYESALDADSELVAEIEVLRDDTENRRELILEKQHEIAEAKSQLEADRTAVARVRAEHASALAEREEVLDEKGRILASIKRKKAHFEALEERASRQIEALLASAGSSAAGPLPTGGGQFLWPAAGPLTSPYGWRTHPIFGDQRLHAGIDIGAPYGAPVIAADEGTVTYVGVMSGYGNVIVLDHGGGVATTYNHLSAYSVGSGQSVGRGSPIGAVGCTGYCTGPHLHFEVRVNGSPVDPMPYLQ
ncbi:MAG: murein hydrolase activator EnvC family protein [Actinomycetota bacterium]